MAQAVKSQPPKTKLFEVYKNPRTGKYVLMLNETLSITDVQCHLAMLAAICSLDVQNRIVDAVTTGDTEILKEKLLEYQLNLEN